MAATHLVVVQPHNVPQTTRAPAKEEEEAKEIEDELAPKEP